MANYNIDAIYNGNTSLPGTERVRIDSSGNIGIGTATPSTKLHIYENANRVTYISQNDNHTARFEAYGTATAIDTTASNGIFFRINSGDIVKFAADGNVGIGTSTARAPLDIYRASNPFIRVNGGGAYSYIQMDDGTSTGYLIKNTSSGTSNGALAGAMYTYTDSSKAFQHIHSGTPLFTILSGGNVGIGTTAPNDKLDVVGRVYAYRYIAVSSNAASPAYATDTNTGMFNAGSNIIGFSISSAEKMRLNADGNLGIGTSSPAYKLEVNGNFAAGGTSTIGTTYPQLTLNGTTNQHAYLIINRTNYESGIQFQTSGTTKWWMYMPSGNDAALRFYTNQNSSGDILNLTNTGNVGIGTTSPGAKLEVYGVVRVSESSSGGILQLTAGASAIDIASTFYGGSRRPITFTMDGEKMRITADGNVGIGTTSPSAKLEIAGFSTGAGLKLNYGNSSGTIEAVNFIANGAANGVIGMQMVSAGVGDLWLGGSGGRILTLYRDGNVGIGTTSPAYKLDVNGSINTNTFMYVSYPYGNAYPFQISANNFLKADNYYYGMLIRSGDVNYISGRFQINGGSNKRVEVSGYEETVGYLPVVIPGGNVGIGTTSPSQKLEVNGTVLATAFVGPLTGNITGTAASAGALNTNNDYTVASLTSNGFVYSGSGAGSTGAFYFNTSSHGIRRASGTNDVYCYTTSGTLYLGADGSSTTHIRVLSGGDVGIGVSPSYKLDVNGNIHGTGFPTSSDVRFKKNITPLQNSLEKIKKLQGVKYEWNEFVNSRRDGYKLNIPIIGLIAQDVEQVVPEIVDHWKLSEDCQDARSIDYPRLIPLLIEAMKEQQNQIEELRNEIKSLKSN